MRYNALSHFQLQRAKSEADQTLHTLVEIKDRNTLARYGLQPMATYMEQILANAEVKIAMKIFYSHTLLIIKQVRKRKRS